VDGGYPGVFFAFGYAAVFCVSDAFYAFEQREQRVFIEGLAFGSGLAFGRGRSPWAAAMSCGFGLDAGL